METFVGEPTSEHVMGEERVRGQGSEFEVCLTSVVVADRAAVDTTYLGGEVTLDHGSKWVFE